MFIYSKEHAKAYLLPEFVINTFLDTNILVSLVDNSFETLNKAIDILRECMFASLISSTYVIFEFIGARKREYYLREVFYKSIKFDTGAQPQLEHLNLSSLLLFRGDFNSQLVDYDSVEEKIKTNINNDIERVVRDFGIEYDSYKIHNDLFGPVKDLFLSTQISKEDSFVLCSAFWPDGEERTRNLLLLTNDSRFAKSYRDTEQKLNSFFANYAVTMPTVYAVDSIRVEGIQLNLLSNLDEVELRTRLRAVILEELIKHNKYVGKTNVPPKVHNNIVCFDLVPDAILPEKLVLIIIAKDLSFCFITQHPIQSILDQGVAITYPYSSPTGKDLCMALDLQQEGLDSRYGDQQDLAINLLRQPSHLLFLHPDL